MDCLLQPLVVIGKTSALELIRTRNGLYRLLVIELCYWLDIGSRYRERIVFRLE